MTATRTAVVRAMLSAVALAYLGVMFVSGAPPTHENRVESAVAGLLGIAPGKIKRIRLERGGKQSTFRRGASAWQRDGRAVMPSVNATLERALGLLHRAPPIRILGPEQTAGIAPATYGLDPPELRIVLDGAGEAEAFDATFGDRVSEGNARYVRVAGRPETFIVSGFLYDAWSALAL